MTKYTNSDKIDMCKKYAFDKSPQNDSRHFRNHGVRSETDRHDSEFRGKLGECMASERLSFKDIEAEPDFSIKKSNDDGGVDLKSKCGKTYGVYSPKLTARYYILPDDGHTEKNKNKVEYRLLVKHDCKEYEVYTVSNDEFFEKAIRYKKGDFIPGTSIQFETNNFVLDISEMDIL